jgi:ubiquinone biosynthesis protein
MFNELLQLCFTFGLRLAPELSTFFRSLITLEGTLRTLCPGYLAIESAQQMAEEWFRARLTPTTAEQMAKDEMLRLLPVLRRLPTHVERLATQLERGQLTTRVTLFSDPGEVRVLTRLINRVVLGFIGCMVALLSVVLLSIKGGPAFTGDTSLYQFFGYFGLFCGSVVILRVLVAVLHDGLN